jgi:hypothetical protein
MNSSQPSERIAICGVANPQTMNNNSFPTGPVDLSKFHEALFLLIVGDIPTSGTLDAKLQESDVANFASGVTDIPGKTMMQLVATDDNKQVVFNLKAEECSKRYARLLITASPHNNIACAVALGIKPRHAPATDDDAATVAQIVT